MQVNDKMTDNDKVPELTNGQFEEFVKDGIVLVDFFAEWCMPCVMMGPVVDEMSEKFRGKIKFGKVNVDENSGLAQRFDALSIPNFVVFKGGQKIEQFVGGMSADDFEERLKGILEK